MDITIVKTVSIPQAWMEKSVCQSHFGLDGRKPYFQKLLTEFRESSFGVDGYLSPTYKIVLINIAKFEEFLRWKEGKKFR